MRKIILLIFVLQASLYSYSQDSIMSMLNYKFPAYDLKSDLAFIRNKAVNKKYNRDGMLFVGKQNKQSGTNNRDDAE